MARFKLFFGRSVEIRTPGLQYPKRPLFVFLTLLFTYSPYIPQNHTVLHIVSVISVQNNSCCGRLCGQTQSVLENLLSPITKHTRVEKNTHETYLLCCIITPMQTVVKRLRGKILYMLKQRKITMPKAKKKPSAKFKIWSA